MYYKLHKHFILWFRMTRAAYLGWMEHRIMTESLILDHSKWPCRKKKWNNIGTKNRGGRKSGYSMLQYAEDKNNHQSDEDFFVIKEMMNHDDTVRSKKLFLLYIKMDDPNGNNKNTASVAWIPLAKVSEITILRLL